MGDSTVLVRGARQLITLRGPKEARRGPLLRELAIIPDGALLIRNGIIQDVGIARRVERLATARGATEINVTGRVVMPAFVDGLTRLVFAHSGLDVRGDAGPEPERIQQQGFLEGARSLKSLSRLRLEVRCRGLLDDFVRHGTTTVESQSGYGLDNAGELKSLRVYAGLEKSLTEVIPTFLAGSARSPEDDGDPAAYLRDVAAPLLETIARRKLARFVDIRCGARAFAVDAARPFLRAASRFGFGLKLQAQQFAPDEAMGLAVESRAVSISQLNFISDADIELLAQSSAIATLCPGAPYQSGSIPFAPARKLVDQGVAVSLASNFNTECSPFYSMPFILSLACRHMGMTPAEAVCAATINSAYAAGCGDRTGSIEPGKQADLVVFNARDYREIPDAAGTNLTQAVIKDGVVVYRAGRTAARPNA